MPAIFRPLVISLTAAGTVALAASVGYFAARDTLYEADAKRLDSAARRILRNADAVITEIDTILTTVEQSLYRFCSDEELAWLRNLVFRARYIRDIGRLHDNQLICTSTGGRLPAPYGYTRPPDIVTRGGEAILIDRDLVTAPGERALIVQRSRSNVVLAAHAFENFLPEPMQYSTWLRTNLREGVAGLSGTALRAPSTQLKVTGRIESHGQVVSIACSRVSDLCAAALAFEADLRAQNSALMSAFGALGGLAGAGVALAIILGLQQRQTLAAQLHRAIRKDELTLVYEPVIDLGSSRIVGAEVLVRWQDADGNPILPDVFIALAEEHGLIGGITDFVIRRVSDELGDLLRSQDFCVSINVAAVDLIGPDLPAGLDRYVTGQAIPPDRIALELTERSTADREQLAGAIGALRTRGHPVYLDDFGVGYSSLSYLHELGVDTIKIDKSFTSFLGTEAVIASVVPQILSIAETLKLGVIVEGVETRQQESILREMGVRRVQGWLYGKPMSAADLRRRVGG